MTRPASTPAWPVGARVRELGPTYTFVPVLTERPARVGTVRRSLSVLAVVHWDGEPAPDLAHPPHDALALTSWLELAPAAEGEAPPTELLTPSPATAPTALPRPALRLVSLGETDDLSSAPAPVSAPASTPTLRLVSLGTSEDLGALDPDPSSAPERTSR